MKRRKSRVNFFIQHLALADLSNGLGNVLTDIIWKMTLEWTAGNAACKLIKFAQVIQFSILDPKPRSDNPQNQASTMEKHNRLPFKVYCSIHYVFYTRISFFEIMKFEIVTTPWSIIIRIHHQKKNLSVRLSSLNSRNYCHLKKKKKKNEGCQKIEKWFSYNYQAGKAKKKSSHNRKPCYLMKL